MAIMLPCKAVNSP